MASERLIGVYRVLEELGKGGMGTVYRAVDARNGSMVAIKKLKADGTSPEMIERFRREGEALRELNHPNIVKMLDMQEQDGRQYLVLEYVGGGDLAHLMRQTGKMPVQQVLTFAIDIADALTRAHKLNIIHRDLKPANLLIDEKGVLRLTDFGVAHMGSKERVTDSDALMGTIDYMPPESFTVGTVDARGDLWSFGVMLYEMLTGERPFQGANIAQVAYAITSQPVPDLEKKRPDAPIALIDLIYRMLEQDTHARIASARHVGAALEDMLQGRPVNKNRFAAPVSDTQNRAKHNLPAQTTPFVGRETEIEELTHLLHTPLTRLVTILAPGGMGKTRLALAVAEHLLDTFEHQVYFVDLAPVSDASAIVTAVAKAVGYQFQSDGREQEQQLLDYLSGKQLLLLMDNFEHLLDGTGLVTDMLQAAPQVKILATSRQRLNQKGETLFHLEGMNFPAWETPADALDYAAVKLFMNSAKRAKPDFELQTDQLGAVARICRMVQGMPLGIVLAASWLAMLTPHEIAGELAKGIDILESSEFPERQRSIRAVMDYSWHIMTEDERQVFMKLALFQNGFTREAAQEAAGANLRQLMSLVHKSLIRRNADTGRYQIHELLRQYAQAKLEAAGNASSAHDAHASYFNTFTTALWQSCKDQRQIEALHLLDADIENVRTAWHHLLKTGQVLSLRDSAKTLWCYYDLRSNHAGALELFEKAESVLEKMDQSTERDVMLGHIIARRAWHLSSSGQHDDGLPLAESALALLCRYDCAEETVMAYESLAVTLLFLHRHAEMLAVIGQGLAIARSNNHRWGEAHLLYYLALAHLNLNHPQQALETGSRGLDIISEIGDTWMIACFTGILLPYVYTGLNRFGEAREVCEKGLELFSALNQQTGITTMYINLGWVASSAGDYEQAVVDFIHAFRRSVQFKYDWIGIQSAMSLVFTFTELHQYRIAARILGGLALLNHVWVQEDMPQLKTRLQSRLEASVFELAWEHGASVGYEQATLEGIEAYVRK